MRYATAHCRIGIWPVRCIGLAFAVVFLASAATAQLAITEVMPATRTNPDTDFRGGDYWELTNFGTNTLSLHNYSFRDANPRHNPLRSVFSNLVIRAGESIVFCRIDPEKPSAVTLSDFRQWWGDDNLPADLQCRFWVGTPGFSGWEGDEVWLFDPAGRVVDHVQFSRARIGRAFTYEPESGLFGLLSVGGVDGAFTAVWAEDVGSPGFAPGAVAVNFLQQPSSQAADAGGTAIFTAIAAGMPPPRYQWFRHGVPIGHASSNTLVLANVQPADAGEYYVYISNGLSSATSRLATLTVNTQAAAPTIVSPPQDATVFSGQTAVFSVVARGVPAPVYQWQVNGLNIPGATGPTLQVTGVTEALSGRSYSVHMSNQHGSAHASAGLFVGRRPDLRFTEVMPLPAAEEDNRHFDWFEITNFDTNAVNLLGWRFSDEPSFARVITIQSNFILHPGRCAIFAERLSAELFGAWWGADTLPPGLPVWTYSGFGLGAFGEVIFLWNPAATDPQDYVATVSWARATPGVTFECTQECDPEGGGCVDSADIESVPGVRGAFRAVEGGHIGSPGYIDQPALQILSISRGLAGDVVLRCRVRDGRAYRLRRAAALSAPDWTLLPTSRATNNVLTLQDQPPATGSVFYRLEEVP